MLAPSRLVVLGLLFAACGAAQPAPKTSAAPPAPPIASPRPPAVPPPPPRADGRLPDNTKPVRYLIELDVDPAAKTFAGHVRLSVHLSAPSPHIVLHARNLRLAGATVAPANLAPAPLTWSFRAPANGKGEQDELVLAATTPIPAGDATLDLHYAADFSEGLNGLYHVTAAGRAYAFTQFEPVGARFAFPCFDEPSAKVPFELRVTAPKDLAVLSNMPERAATPSADGAKVMHAFAESPPLPTYLVALAVGPLELRAAVDGGEGVPLRIVSTPGGTALGGAALATARDHVRVLERYFGTPYPYPKLDLVAVPNFAAGAMENAGLVTFREERLLLDEKTAPTSMRRALHGVIAHELSHMWFGDLVTMRWWNDLWLNEAFATWMATRVLDTWRPETRASVEALTSTGNALHGDALDSARAVRQPVRSTTEALESFDAITYVKGAALLGMVERWIGPETFQQGIRAYLSEHRFGNATSEDLFAALGRASGKDVAGVLATFTDQTGVPLVTFEACRVDAGHAVVPIRQSQYRPLGPLPANGVDPTKVWKLPVCVHFGTGPSGHVCTLLDGTSGTIPLPTATCPPTLYPNADQAGYYRSNIGEAERLALGKLGRDRLTSRERVGLLMDAWAMLEVGAFEVPAYFALAKAFDGAPEAEVWDEITDAIDTLGTDIVEERDADAFARQVRALLSKEAARLGPHTRPRDNDAIKRRRRLVLATLGKFGQDAAVLSTAKAVTAKWIARQPVDGDEAALGLPLAARTGDEALFTAIAARLGGDALPVDRVLASTALGSFNDAKLVERALGLVLDGTIRSQDQIYVFRQLFGRRETRQIAFDLVAQRVDEFLAKIPPFARRRLIPIIAQSCSDELVSRAYTLFTPRLPTLEGADRGLAQALEEGMRCAALNRQVGPAVSAWVNGAK